MEAAEACEERREVTGEVVGTEVKKAEAVVGGVGSCRHGDSFGENVAMEAEINEAFTQVPHGGREWATESDAGEVEVGESGRVAETRGGWAGEGVGGEVEGGEGGEGTKVGREAAGEGGVGEADGGEEEGGVVGEGDVGACGYGVACEGMASGRGLAEAVPEAERHGGVPGGELGVGGGGGALQEEESKEEVAR